MSLGSIARKLSRLERFSNPKLELEQYPTPGELAAELIWTATLNGDIEGKRVIDLGAGTGVLGIGALLAGASHVTFIEIDADAVAILGRNVEGFDTDRYTVVTTNVSEAAGTYDTCIMNPPFGAQAKHADRSFLMHATRIARTTYSIHNANSRTFLAKLAADEGWRLQVLAERRLPLKSAYAHHKKPVRDQSVILIRVETY